MKRILAIFLSIALLVTALPIGMITLAEDSASVNTSITMQADDTRIHRSANGVKAYTAENGLAGQYGNIEYDYKNRSVKACIYNLKNIMLNACADNGDRGIDRYPYVITKINVKVADYYNIGVEINMNASSEVDTMVFVVDGAVHVIKLQKGTSAKQTVGKELYLSAGEHYIMYMSAMPQNESDCPSTDATVKNWYPWTNFWSFTFENESGRDINESLEIMDASTLAETDVENIINESTRIEAEDTKYVTWNIYSKTEDNTSASGGKVVGGPAYAQCQQTFEEFKNGGLDKAKTPYLQYMVEAPAAGEYYLTIGANVGKSSANPSTTVPFVAVLVNDNEPVKAQFDGAWGAFDSVTVPVQLQEGINIIRCTSVTPEQYSTGTAWVNLDYFEVQKGLIACPIEVKATDSDYGNYLYLNRYKYQETENNFGGPSYDDMRWDYPSLYEEMLGIYSKAKTARANYWPYIAFAVCAEKSGEYQISANIGTNANAKTIGMIVDGAMHVIDVTTTSGDLTKSVYLTEGEHVIVFTSPIFRDMVSRPAIGGNNTQYPYMNFKSFKLSAGLSFVEKPTDADIQTAMTNYTRIEAEDFNYATYNAQYGNSASKKYAVRYTKDGKTSPTTGTQYEEEFAVSGATDSAIDTIISESETNVNTTQEYADIAAGKLDKKLTSYIQYVVKAEKAGKYVLRIGAYVEGEGTMPYGTILVNGEAYKAQFSGNWNGWDAVNLPVELKAGINTIQCVGITADQASKNTAWIGYDYLDIPKGVTASDIEVKAEDSDCETYLYLNGYTDKGTYFGGSRYGDLRWDYPSLYEEMLGIYSDVKKDRANYWDYIAFTVRAEQAGEYEISAKIGTNANAKTIGMIVDGAMHVIDVTTTSGELTKSVYLTEGEHVIIFTSPMPRDMESRPSTTGTNVQYPYMDFNSFKLSAGLSFVEKPADADIQTAMTNYLRIEAEDTLHASANGNYNADISKGYATRYNGTYTVKVKGFGGAAIDGAVSESETNVNTTQTYAELVEGNLNQDLTSYVQYKVMAEKAGNYVIRVGAYVEGSGTMPYGTILVNGKAYQAQFSGNWNGYDVVNLAVELQAGENIIQCVGVTADQTAANGWIGYDYLEIPRELNYHEPGEYTDTSVESGLTFEKRTTYETEGAISHDPYTISAWVYLPSGYTSRGGVIFGNYVDSKTPCVSFEISDNGVPRFYHINDNGELVNLAFDKASINADEWTNLTFTISGNTVSCYKNGVIVGTKTSDTVDIDMSAVENQYVLGGDLRQQIATHGTTNTQYFKGRIIDVALYNSALSEDDVLKVYEAETITTEPYTRYKLENAEKDKDVPDAMSNNHLDAKSAYFTDKEAVTDYAYSFAVVGDTQIVTENDVNNKENNLSKIYDWILANQEQKKIQYVFGLGDITDNNTTAEWAHAQEQISKLDGKIPYSLVRGNHDVIGYGAAEDKEADYMTQYLGTNAYKSQFAEEIGGFYGDSISNSWRTFTVGEVQYLILALDYAPSDDVLTWAGNIIKEHPEHNVIITTHAYLRRDGTRLDGTDGDNVWTKLVSQYENIVLVMSGHDPSDNIVMSREVGVNGNVVTSMLIDPQDVDTDDGSTGMLAMLYFSEDGTKVQVEYFSTVRNEYFKEENQFSFEFKIDDCDRKVKEYSAEQVAQFKANNEYPNDVEGYLFAGWYTDEACDKASLLGTATPTGTTYALFVPKHVLSVKAQISANLLDSDTTNDDTASIRFVTTVDTLLYQQVGFKISYVDASGQKQEVTSANGTVYQRLYAVNSESEIDTLTPNKYFCGLSTYFKACTIINIPKDCYGTEFTVTPFWITMDGATVYGDTVTKTVNMGIPK